MPFFHLGDLPEHLESGLVDEGIFANLKSHLAAQCPFSEKSVLIIIFLLLKQKEESLYSLTSSSKKGASRIEKSLDMIRKVVERETYTRSLDPV